MAFPVQQLPALAAEPLSQALTVTVAEEQLSVQAVDAPLAQVLQLIADKAGFRLLLHGGELIDSVTTSFSGVAVSEGVLRVLGETPAVLRHFSGEPGEKRLVAVYVLPDSKRRDAPDEKAANVVASSEEPPVLPQSEDQGLTPYASPERARRIEEVQRLASQAGPSNMPALVERLHSDDPIVRRTAAVGLGKVSQSKAIPALRTALHDSDHTVRLRGVLALAKHRDPQATRFLGMALMHDALPHVRRLAARKLGYIGGSQALTALQTAQSDPDPSVRHAVETALDRWDGS